MPIISVRIPQLGEGLQEALLVEFLKQPGDDVARDEPIYVMETDKAVTEVESPYAGKLVEWVVETNTSTSFTSKAFALEIGGGWEWRLSRRFGTQVFGSQHVATLGDLETATTRVENVVGNFWSLGGAIVIR